MVDLANTWARDFNTAGIPASGVKKPEKSKIREWGTYVESLTMAANYGNTVWFATKALLTADLAHAAGVPAIVYADTTAANNGIYIKAGASGAGSWGQIITYLPGYQFVTATDAGAGTANAIVATSSPRVAYTDGVQLVRLNIFETNTSGTVTVAFDGGAALSIKTASNNNPAIGGLTAGMTILGVVDQSATVFRMLSDQASAAIVVDAEAAQAAAETAQTGAEAAEAAAIAAAALSAQRFVRALVVDTTGSAVATAYEAGDAVDGVTLAAGDIVLRATSGGDPADGLYVASASGAASRSSQFDTYDKHPGSAIRVIAGSTKANTEWRINSALGGTLDTTDILIEEFSASSSAAVKTIAALKALAAPAAGDTVVLTEAGRERIFIFKSGDYSAEVAADTLEGVYLKADDTAATAGAWVAILRGDEYEIEWFGGKRDDAAHDNAAALNAAVALSIVTNVGTIRFRNGSYTFLTAPAPIGVGLFLRGGGQTSSGLHGGTILRRSFNMTSSDAFIHFDGSGISGNGTGGGITDIQILAETGFTGGKALNFTATSTLVRCGYMSLQNVGVFGTGTGTWNYCCYLNGAAVTTPGSQGVRDFEFTGCWFAGATSDTVLFDNAVNVFFNGTAIYQASGSVATLVISGAGTGVYQKSTNIAGFVEVLGTVTINNADNVSLKGVISAVTYSAMTVSPNSYVNGKRMIATGVAFANVYRDEGDKKIYQQWPIASVGTGFANYTLPQPCSVAPDMVFMDPHSTGGGIIPLHQKSADTGTTLNLAASIACSMGVMAIGSL